MIGDRPVELELRESLFGLVFEGTPAEIGVFNDELFASILPKAPERMVIVYDEKAVRL